MANGWSAAVIKINCDRRSCKQERSQLIILKILMNNPTGDGGQPECIRASVRPKIETDLSEMLYQINSKLDNMSSNITELKIGQVKVETKLETAIGDLTEIKSTQKTLVSDVADLKTATSGLTEIKSTQKTLVSDVAVLKTVPSDLTEIKTTQKTLVSDVADLKGAKSLVIPIVVAVTVSILTLVIRSIPIA